MIEIRGFNGKLNQDDNPYRLPKNDYIDALNITRDAQGHGQDEVVSNIVGNDLVYHEPPDVGTNKVIGSYADRTRNREYFFTWNDEAYHRISYYDRTLDTIIVVMENLTNTNGIDVLKFDASYRINHTDLIIRDEGDLLFWTDGLNPPRKINVLTAETGGYGTIIESYIDVAKEPPSSPPYCVYEDNPTIKINNLNNKLFKFKYRYVFDDLEKSVTSAQCEVPIPKDYMNQTTAANPAKNSSIFILMDSGPANVTKIEILGAESLGVNWSDFFLIKVLNKADLGIYNNNTAQFKFYNDQAYNTIPLSESIQPFDNVPQIAYTQSLPNGNVLDYGAITENYDLIIPDYEPTILNNSLLSSHIGQTALVEIYFVTEPIEALKIIIAGNPSIGDVYYLIYSFDGIQSQQVVVATGITTASLQTNIGAAFTFNGFSVQIDSDNNLIVSYPPNVLNIWLPTAIVPITTLLNRDSQLVYDWFSRYSYGVIYFDDKGRTNSVITSLQSTFETQRYAELSSAPAEALYIPQQQFSINSRPPNWASYFEIIRTKNLTKSNFLQWISVATYLDAWADSLGIRYAYISIASLTTVLSENSSYKALGYEFIPGDRIRFLKLYTDVGGTAYTYVDRDYAIIESATNPLIADINGTVIVSGQVLKIIASNLGVPDFGFGGSFFKNYLIEIYTPAPNFSNELNLYYEFGQKYSVGNSGTNSAYHYGMIQNQLQNLTQPALYNFYKGDSYFRYRSIPTGGVAKWSLAAHNGYPAGITIYCMVCSLLENSTNRTTVYTPKSATNGLSINPMPVSTFFMTLVPALATTVTFKITGQIIVRSSVNINNAYLVIYQWNSGGFAIPFSDRVIVGLDPLVAGEDKTILITNYFTPSAGAAGLSFGLQGFAGDILDNEIIFTDTRTLTQGIIDPNFSDAYDSTASPNGRAWKFDPNAARAFNPTLIRFGGEFQASTTLNDINRFYEDSYDQYDRSRGSIRKMFIEGRNQYIFQEFDVGVVTVLTQIVRDTAGNPLSAQSEKLLNKIVYPYIGQYGIGDIPESFAYGKHAKYFIDSNKGVVCRLSNDGITPLSILYKMNAFFVAALAGYKSSLNIIIPTTGTPTVYGAFDAYTNKYIIAMEAIDRPALAQPALTLSFIESRDTKEGFESFLSFEPENMGALDNLFMTFKDGQLWKHNSNTFCNFYGIQHNASIDVVFNDASLDKKTYLSIMETANDIWYCPIIISQLNSYGSTSQFTEISEARFKQLEGQYYSAILRDLNSPGGIINGDTMHGNYLVVRFQKDNAGNFYYINTVSLSYNNSPLNLR